MSRELSWWKRVRCWVLCFILRADIAHLFSLAIWIPNTSTKKLWILSCYLLLFLWSLERWITFLPDWTICWYCRRTCVGINKLYIIYSCNNFAWEPSWICLACSQYDAVSHWYSEGKAINTSLSLANEIFKNFFYFNQNDCHGLAWEIATCKSALKRDVGDLNNARCECLVLANELPGTSQPQ